MGVKKVMAVFGGLTTGGSLTHADVTPDFSGYVTKYDIRCTDGRTIKQDAFKDQDGARVPLVWQHNHDSPENVLGHMVLEHRDDGVYGDAFFNTTTAGRAARVLVQNGDIKFLSIHANELIERAKSVYHGVINEVSTVLRGANPGAMIDNIQLAHGDGELTTLSDEAIITTGEEIVHADSSRRNDDGPTAQDIYDDMTDDQRAVVLHMVDEAYKEGQQDSGSSKPDKRDVAAAHAALPDKDDTRKVSHSMSRNLFDKTGRDVDKDAKPSLEHGAVQEIVQNAVKMGSFQDAVKDYGLKHGIENIDLLFPDARTLNDTPELDTRRMEWVTTVLNGTRKNPFSRIKSIVADLTQEQARAKGYIKGRFKKEEWFALTRRITTPTTFYKKQKLERDDIIDITDFDVVIWVKAEMRIMLDEELARSILIGDGREVDDEDKIRDPQGVSEGAGIRSILHDHDLYAATITIDTSDARTSPSTIIDAIIDAKRFYKGSGSPTWFTTIQQMTNLLLAKDSTGRRLYNSESELANAIGVSSIVTVEPMEDIPDLIGIIVNLRDYTIGADRGGQITFFDDFDIDFNNYKYLLEGRCSGALTKIRSALILRSADTDDVLAVPTAPAFDRDTNRVTVPTVAGVVYRRADTGATLRTDTPITLDRVTLPSLKVFATPTAGYYFENNIEDEWTFAFQE